MDVWMEQVLNDIENHLTEELDIAELARQTFLSRFYFQRIFRATWGMGVGEYIRNRRLALAGEDLLNTDAKVIEIAAKYGYDSPDSFRRAFVRFHGISPSEVRKYPERVRKFPPLSFQKQEDITMLAYRIEKKEAFQVMGVSRVFFNETSYQDIPKFWDEVFRVADCPLAGKYGICMDSADKNEGFVYMIADDYWGHQDIPAGFRVETIPAAAWAVFPCRGPLPEALQSVNTRIWTQWLPDHKEYPLAMNLTVEMYAPMAQKPEDTYSEIWIPVTETGE